MTAVRIAHAEPRPGRLANGGFSTSGFLVVLADDVGHRAVPIWMQGEPGDSDLSQLLELATRPPGEIVTADAPEELTARLLRAASASVTGLDIDVTEADTDELSPRVAVARVGLRGPGGTRHVMAGLGLGLAMAAATGAPVRLADAALDRLAAPVSGDDLLSPFLDRVPPAGQPITLSGQRPRYEPRNLSFTDGLDRWDLDRGSRGQGPTRQAHEDYSAAADGQSAILSSAAPQPLGSAALLQTIFADDYRGATVAFGGEIRTEPEPEPDPDPRTEPEPDPDPGTDPEPDPGTDPGTGQARLRLEILTRSWRDGRGREDHSITISGGHDWTSHEITAPVPEDADLIRFGIALTGPGRIALRSPELRRSGA